MRESTTPLELGDVLRMQSAGAQVIDVRDGPDFAGAHLRGTINIGLRGKYATWCGTLLDRMRPIVVIAESGDQEEAIMRLGRIGLDQVAGYLAGGMQALEARPDLIETTPRITAPALADRLAGGEEPLVVDVRAAKERATTGFVAGSINIPLSRLNDSLAELPQDRQIIVHCAGGYRSAIAASLLQRSGYEPLDLIGGFQAWTASRLPVVEPTAA